VSENQIDIIIEEDGWSSISGLGELVSKSAMEALSRSGDEDGEVAILLTNSEKIRSLNHQFRGKDSATNVLSFPSDDEGELGDVALCWEVISKEAEEQGKEAKDHLVHLVVHGVLHLVGYDHEDDKDASEMENLEIEILKSFSINNPYEE
jgi:probable rRNA maturation factor